MPHQVSPKFTWPRIVERESGQAGPGLPAARSAPGPATQMPTRGWPSGVAVGVRTLRELCHDLTMPATSIRLLVSAATRESDPDPPLRARLCQIADEASRIADICGYFLDPARRTALSDLRMLAAYAADSARSRYLGTIDVVAEPLMAVAHPVDVVRILANLLDNACRAAGPEGRVRLAVERGEERALMIVADSGPGFGNGESGQASLGLGIVAALVRRNNGDLRMGTSDLGGLAVAVALPVGAR